MQNTISSRATRALNLDQYRQTGNSPEKVGETGQLDLKCPYDRQYVLRMLIQEPFGLRTIPKELHWIEGLINLAEVNQMKMGIRHPYCYVTIRHGIVDSVTDDEWHVDGFSMNISQLPEQNYVWCSDNPTEYTNRLFFFREDFDARRHNIQDYINEIENKSSWQNRQSMEEKTVYCFDPYTVHRRPSVSTGTLRTFVKVFFCPIIINDVNNTQNPHIPKTFTRDGVKDFRNKLVNYHEELDKATKSVYN